MVGDLIEGMPTPAFSGSLPGAPTDGYARIARIANGRSVPVLADAYGPALAAVLAERPAVVKVNACEASEATGLAVSDPRSAAMAARALVARGAACVVVTLGVDGSVIVTAHEQAFFVRPPSAASIPWGAATPSSAALPSRSAVARLSSKLPDAAWPPRSPTPSPPGLATWIPRKRHGCSPPWRSAGSDPRGLQNRESVVRRRGLGRG